MSPSDFSAIGRQRETVFDMMTDNAWHTLQDLGAASGFPLTSISARIRDFRKAEYGGYVVDLQRKSSATSRTYEYRVGVRPIVNAGVS